MSNQYGAIYQKDGKHIWWDKAEQENSAGRRLVRELEEKSGGYIARQEPETMEDNQQEDEQLYRV